MILFFELMNLFRLSLRIFRPKDEKYKRTKKIFFLKKQKKHKIENIKIKSKKRKRKHMSSPNQPLYIEDLPELSEIGESYIISSYAFMEISNEETKTEKSSMEVYQEERKAFMEVYEEETKVEKLEKEITIQTHSGKFHADECAAVALLSSLFASQGYNVTVIRSRDSKKFEFADILVDVGLEYDPSRHRYDHHQKSCNEVWVSNRKTEEPQDNEKEIPLSSVGLVWRHFGKDILSVYLNTDYFGEFECNDKIITDLWHNIYYKIIQDLDAHDNGIVLQNPNNLNIPAIISAMNTTGDEIEQNSAFQYAVTLIGQIFEIKFKEIITSYFKFSQDVEKVEKLLHELNKNVDTPPDANPEHTYLILQENIPTIYKCLNKLDPECQVVFLIFDVDSSSVSVSSSSEYDVSVKETANKVVTLKTRRRMGESFASICNIAPEEVLREKMSPEDFACLTFLHKGLFIAKFTSMQAAISCVKVSLEYSLYLSSLSVTSPSISSVPLPLLPSVPSVESVVSLSSSHLSKSSSSKSLSDKEEENFDKEDGKNRRFKVDKTPVYLTLGYVALGSMFYLLTRR